jgi:hypothetical protein
MRMRLLRLILIISEVLFVLLFVFPPVVESRPLARAIVADHDDPSAQKKSELEHQQAVVHGRRLGQSIFIFVLLAANSAGLFYVSRRVQLGRETSLRTP